MAVLSETAKKWKKITGTNITQGYGLTETSPVVTINKIDDSYNGSIGIPLQSTDVKIIDENGISYRLVKKENYVLKDHKSCRVS